MEVDERNVYRKRLDDDPPAFLDRVNTPWDVVPDLEEYNEHAFSRIHRTLRELARRDSGQPEGNSRGILILGEAGTGKTHLLMRVARNLSQTNHILFVRKPNNEEAVAQHIWKNIVDSLSRKLSTEAGARSQLDDMLAHIFSKVLLPGFREDIAQGIDVETRQRWIDRLEADPYQLFEMLGDGERRSDNLDRIRRRTLRFLRTEHPDANQEIAHVLITYCLVSREEHKRLLLNWLGGSEIEESEAKSLGLTPGWFPIDETSTDAAVSQQREELALRAIQTVGILATYYHPLILTFDQLEGLRNQTPLTHRWGDVVREIFTMAPNYLIVTCIFPSLWETWFRAELDQSAAERIAQQTIELERFEPAYGARMLARHLEASVLRHNLPTNIYPFTVADIEQLCQQATSPRSFLQGARGAFERWLDGESSSSQPLALTEQDILATEDVERVLRESLDGCELAAKADGGPEQLLDHDLFGQMQNLVLAFLKSCNASVQLTKASYRNQVMPANIIITHRQTGARLCLATLNCEGNAAAARLRNLNHCQKQGGFRRLVMIRDRRCRKLGARSLDRIREAEEGGAVFVDAGRQELAWLSALYSTLVAIEERDLTVGRHVLELSHYAAFLKNNRILIQSEVFRGIGEACPPLAELVGVNAPPGRVPAGVSPPSPLTDNVSRSGVTSTPNSLRSEPEVELANEPQPPRKVTTPSSATASVPPPGPPTTVSTPIAEMVIGSTSLQNPHVGILGQLVDGSARVGISLTKPQCLVLLGYMGSGKSYALGVLIENALLAAPGLIQQERPMAVVAFNFRRNSQARFEYAEFGAPNSKAPEVQTLREEYGVDPVAIPTVNVLAYAEEIPRRTKDYVGCIPYPIQFRSDELGAEHWEILMKPPSREAEYMDIVRQIIQRLFYDGELNLANLERAIETDARFTSPQRRRAMNRISFAEQWISDDRQFEWSDLLKEGSLTIVDLRVQSMEANEALKICLIVADMVRRQKKRVNRVIVFDEAHEYVDCRELVGELENCITQMRHDGVSFVLASQFPERIPRRIFKYMLTRFIFKLPSTEAVSFVRTAAPNLQGLSPTQVSNLDLEAGVCFVQSDDECTPSSLKNPTRIKIRPRLTQHGGATNRQPGSEAEEDA